MIHLELIPTSQKYKECIEDMNAPAGNFKKYTTWHIDPQIAVLLDASQQNELDRILKDMVKQLIGRQFKEYYVSASHAVRGTLNDNEINCMLIDAGDVLIFMLRTTYDAIITQEALKSENIKLPVQLNLGLIPEHIA